MTIEEEFAEFAEASTGRLRRAAMLLCGDWHGAEDLTQSALAKVFVSWRRIRLRRRRRLHNAAGGLAIAAVVALVVPVAATNLGQPPASPGHGSGPVAYVLGTGAVTPVYPATRTAGQAIILGGEPDAIAITPDGKTAYIANAGSHSVTPVNIATHRAGKPIQVGATPGQARQWRSR